MIRGAPLTPVTAGWATSLPRSPAGVPPSLRVTAGRGEGNTAPLHLLSETPLTDCLPLVNGVVMYLQKGAHDMAYLIVGIILGIALFWAGLWLGYLIQTAKRNRKGG